MKRLFCICLLLCLLCACGNDRVPAYEAEEVPTTSETDEELTLLMSAGELPDGQKLYHLSDVYNTADSQCNKIEITLQSYNETLDKWEVCCVTANCAHMDESCTAWFGSADVYRRFAVINGICYCAEGEYGKYALNSLDFYALNPATGERKTYFSISAEGEKEIYLGNVAICGQTAILNYSTLKIDEQSKMQYIMAFDLRKDSAINVMQREILNGEVYELWGMNETHMIVSYLHSGGNYTFAEGKYSMQGLSDHSKYMMDQHRWVLLEFPIEENAQWSQQIAQYASGSDLRLYNHGNFYCGTLYYALNDTVWAYDLQEHKNSALFVQAELEYMSCLDGKILYLTQENECFSFDLATSETTKIAAVEYFPVAETDTGFYCQKIKFTGSYDHYFIEKESFYAQRMDEVRSIY